MTAPAEPALPTWRSHVTLALCTVLHAFTHAFASLLVPLYLLMRQDLHLGGIGAASLVVTLYGAVYNLGSYGGGRLADRFDRKVLLAIGLLGNAAAIIGIGLSRDYYAILALGIAAGAFGTLFHPAANALASSHYPKSPAMAIGILGIGSGLGFFFGPQIAGWRAHAAHWHLDHVAQWQKPCIELGIVGLIVGVLFLWLGQDPHTNLRRQRIQMPPKLTRSILCVAPILMFRDFAGVAGLSLAAIYYERVFHFTVEHAGLYVGLIMLPSVLVSPLMVYLSPGRRRLPTLRAVLLCAAAVVVTVPLWPQGWAFGFICLFQTLQLGSYALSDSAMLERVAPAMRGRVSGLFLVIAGTGGSLGPWAMGGWADLLGLRASVQHAYAGPFAALAVCMAVSAFAVPFIARMGEGQPRYEISPLQEIAPATMGIP